MSADEFSIIQRYFSSTGKLSSNLVLGVGDDAAVITVPTGYQQVVCMDTLISGIHFPKETSAADVAWKSLAVNLSDLAAMAAKPDWFQLSLTIPQADEHWLAGFAAGLHESALQHQIGLIGGDTCRGPLSITIQATGLVPIDGFISRASSQPGDLIVVSGVLGEAAMGLDVVQGKLDLQDSLAERCLLRLNRPMPRLELSEFLRQHAHSAIDISDGLVADLKHILEQSNTGAIIYANKLPVLPWAQENQQLHYALYGGDDYEICCTVPVSSGIEIDQWNHLNPHCQLSVIGEITSSGYVLDDGNRQQELSVKGGYKHFD